MAEERIYHPCGSRNRCFENEKVPRPPKNVGPSKSLSPSKLRNVSQFLKRWLPNSTHHEEESSTDDNHPPRTEDTPAKKNCPTAPSSSLWLPVDVTHQPSQSDSVSLLPDYQAEGAYPAPGKTANRKGCDGEGELQPFDGANDRYSPQPQTCLPGNVDWKEYRNFLMRVWEENSLASSSLDAESSTLPSLSSLSGDFPFAIDLLSNDKMFTGNENIDESSTEAHMEKYSSSRPPVTNERDHTFSPPEEVKDMKASKALSDYSNAKQKDVLEIETQPLISVEGVSCAPQRYQDNSQWQRLSLPPRRSVGGRRTPPGTTRGAITTYTDSSLKTDTKKTPFGFPRGSNATSDTNRWQVGHEHAPTCPAHTDEIATIKKELEDAQERIKLLSAQMESQSSHLKRLIDARKGLPGPIQGYHTTQNPPIMSYPVFPQGYKTPPHVMYPQPMGTYAYNPHHHVLGRRTSCQYPCDAPRGRMMSGFTGMEPPANELDPRALESLRDRIVALQMQNVELNLFLKKEELRRKEAEEAVRKEKEYVQKLQNSLQDLSTSTLVMDPMTYKQVADKYIASRKKPVRRTHTCQPTLTSSDLVCDSTKLQVTQIPSNQSTSCPSSPLGAKQGRMKPDSTARRLSPTIPLREDTLSSSFPLQKNPLQGKDSSEGSDHHSDSSITWSVEAAGGGTPMNSKDYQDLLHSLNDLDVSSSSSRP